MMRVGAREPQGDQLLDLSAPLSELALTGCDPRLPQVTRNYHSIEKTAMTVGAAASDISST